ncbi:MFS transporter [Paenibacillus sp. GCM10027627]|uniref:MFS transporter n=1 Tax=unclassified Paenibacillus TaxID=185978 RepID=UPI003626B0BC
MQSQSSTPSRSIEPLLRVMMFTLMLSAMGAMMFNIVLPQISEQFQLSLAEVSWMTSAYSLIYAVGTVTYGKLSDRFKLKNILTFGILLFSVGSVIGLFSETFWVALLARCLQSAGASAIPAVVMLIPIRYVAPERRGSALGMAATGLALGGAVGPVVSSLLVSVVDWRWLFAVPLLLLATLPFYRKYLVDEAEGKGQFDWLGGLLLGGMSALLLLGFTRGSVIYILIALAAGILFVVRIRMAAEPFVRPELFKNREYVINLAIGSLVNAIGVSLYFLTPFLLSNVQALPPYWIGLAMVPAAIASAILGRKGGRLADRNGNGVLLVVASSLLMFGFLFLSTFTTAPAWAIAAFLIFGNVGQSFMMIGMSNAVSKTLPQQQMGVGMGLFAMINFLTQGISSGLYGIAAGWQTSQLWNPLNGNANSAAFSNIYLILALLHAALIAFHFIRSASSRKSARVSKPEMVSPANH